MNRVLVILACCIIAAQAASLPKTYKRCSRKDPKLNDCLTKAFVDALQQMRSGIKELGMPSLEPIEVAEYSLNQDKGPVVLNISLTDAKTSGVTDIDLKSFEFDPKELTIKMHCMFKSIKTEADYVISGKFLVLPITGKGKVNYELDDIDGTVSIKFTKKTVKGKEYLDVKDFELIQNKVGHAKFDFQNLFNGDKQLGDALNASMNENWEEMIKALGPSFARVWSEYFKGYSQNIFKNVPYNEIILDK